MTELFGALLEIFGEWFVEGVWHGVAHGARHATRRGRKSALQPMPDETVSRDDMVSHRSRSHRATKHRAPK